MELIAVGVCMVRSIHNENDLQKDEVIFTSRRYLIRRFNNSHQKKPSNCARNAKEIYRFIGKGYCQLSSKEEIKMFSSGTIFQHVFLIHNEL